MGNGAGVEKFWEEVREEIERIKEETAEMRGILKKWSWHLANKKPEDLIAIKQYIEVVRAALKASYNEFGALLRDISNYICKTPMVRDKLRTMPLKEAWAEIREIIDKEREDALSLALYAMTMIRQQHSYTLSLIAELNKWVRDDWVKLHGEYWRVDEYDESYNSGETENLDRDNSKAVDEGESER